MTYLAEFAFSGTLELVNELFIIADSQEKAYQYALKYASNWGVDLFCLRAADEIHPLWLSSSGSVPNQISA